VSVYRDNVSMTVSGTPGTGTITLNAASTGAQSFASAYGANATVDVFITDGSAWEVARDCTYTHSGTTLTRGTLEASSTGARLSLTSAAVVRVAMPAEQANRMLALQQMVTPGGRLTLTSGVPVTTSDVTGATSIFYTPFVHDGIVLWDGNDWRPIRFTETTLALGTLISGRPYDVFGFLNGSGALQLELLAWTNDTTRATAVTLQDGRYCRSGDKTRLLLGTFYTTSTTATADAEATRYLSNVYNRLSRRVASSNSTSHTYTTGAWRQWNNGTGGGRVDWVESVPSTANELYMTVGFLRSNAGTFGYANIGYDATNGSSNLLAANIEGPAPGPASTSIGLSASAALPVAIGRHFAATVQFGETNVTYTATTLQGLVAC
jgi:hypothetical protein